MDGVMSQEEISALLNSSTEGGAVSNEDLLSDKEKDAIGEIANISMGTAATTLFSLVNRKVEISTPVVSFANWSDICEAYEKPCVFIRIGYTVGLDGSNILVLKEHDVKVITDLMMGGDGTNTDGELGELHLSAISEAMNQMMGSAATSMSSMINEMVDISPPTATRVDFSKELDDELNSMAGQTFVQVAFRMEIGDLVDSQIVQLYPIDFARNIYQQFMGVMMGEPGQAEAVPEPTPAPAPAVSPTPAPTSTPTPVAPDSAVTSAVPPVQPQMQQPMMDMSMQQPMAGMQQPVNAIPPQGLNIQPAQFQSFMPTPNLDGIAPENIDLIMDVPLEVTVELGRTSKSIKEILDFSPGTIIELDKLAGEPIDVLVNGKFVAKGEVVVIEESFGIRVTEIIKEN